MWTAAGRTHHEGKNLAVIGNSTDEETLRQGSEMLNKFRAFPFHPFSHSQAGRGSPHLMRLARQMKRMKQMIVTKMLCRRQNSFNKHSLSFSLIRTSTSGRSSHNQRHRKKTSKAIFTEFGMDDIFVYFLHSSVLINGRKNLMRFYVPRADGGTSFEMDINPIIE